MINQKGISCTRSIMYRVFACDYDADDHYPARVDTKTDDIIYIALRFMYKSRQYPSFARATRRKIQSYAAPAAGTTARRVARASSSLSAYVYIGICIRVKKNRGRTVYRNCIQLSDTFITINSNRNDCVRK
uniref:Uncharacterized protein n=1 Tax=Trichogramma kaykai TaxID=54128 RepID=A0ABD2WB48_9HYME